MTVHGLLGVLLLALASGESIADGAGRVHELLGDLRVLRSDGTAQRLSRDAEVNVGDTLSTSEDGYARIGFHDGASLTMRERTSLKIEDFRLVTDRPLEDRLALPVPADGDSISRFEKFRIILEDIPNFFECPDIELAFFAVRICVKARIEPALGMCHFTFNEIKCFNDDLFKEGVFCDLPGMQIGTHELCVIVKHFFKMRHEPDRIDRITMKTAAELIVNPAVRHFVAGLSDHFKRVFIFRSLIKAEQKFQRHRRRKLRARVRSSYRRLVFTKLPQSTPTMGG